MNISRIVFFCFVAGIFLIVGLGAKAACLPLGVYLDDPSTLTSFETLIGRKTDIFLKYQEINQNFDTYTLAPIAASGHTIHLAWEFYDSSLDPMNQPAYQLRKITAGNFDTAIRRWADQIRDSKYTVIFRPMPEMNGDWITWGGTVNGNNPADFVPAWRHMHDIFVAEGATNVKWSWSPNVDYSAAVAKATWTTYYPGDAYVDYIGLDGYNFGTSASGMTWQTLEQIFGPSYDTFAALTTKPFMVSETASTEIGGSKPTWITNTFGTIQTRFPRFANLSWFNTNKETDWRVNSSTQSLQAFVNAMASCSGTCVPKTCSGLGYACGTTSDGCGGTLSCGTCSGSQTCTSNQCVASCTNQCTGGAKQCADNANYQTCGDTNGDGCTEWSTATACGTGQICSSGSCIASCTPKTCVSLGYACGTASDGCSGTLNCGTCASGTCTNNQCVASGTTPAISFVSPTPANGATLTSKSVTIKTTTTEPNLTAQKFNWNGNTYNVYDSSLVLGMNLNNNSAIGESSTKFVDISRNSNNGTCSGTACPTFVASGKFNGAYKFNGTSNVINCGSGTSLNLTNALTIEAWIYPQGNGPGDIVNKGDYNAKKGYALNLDEKNALEFVLGSGSTRVIFTSNQKLPLNTWCHVAAVLSNGVMRGYINGVDTGLTKSFSSTISNITNQLALGRDAIWGEYFNGQIDEVRVYNRALTAAEIAATYQSELQKYDSQTWNFTDTVSGLTPNTTYTCSASATNASGVTANTETRTLKTAATLTN